MPAVHLEDVMTRMPALSASVVRSAASKVGFAACVGVLLKLFGSRPFVRALMLWCARTLDKINAHTRGLFDDPELHLTQEYLEKQASGPSRPQGIAYLQSLPPLSGRVDGAVLLTGGTGFVGLGILLQILARAEDLGVSRVVLMVRQKRGQTAEDRLATLRENPALADVKAAFDKLVVAIEADLEVPHFGWGGPAEAATKVWPCSEPLKVMIHCAANVHMKMPMKTAMCQLVLASIQMIELGTRWSCDRFVIVSTAFVHPKPRNDPLPEQLVDLGEFDPVAVYQDGMSGDGQYAEKAYRSQGHVNTYAFGKAVMENVVARHCEAHGLRLRIVRPSIVVGAWAAPFTGWIGDTATGAPVAAIGASVKAGTSIFANNEQPLAVIPVDIVASAIVDAAAHEGAGFQLTCAAIDASEAFKAGGSRSAFFKSLGALRAAGRISPLAAWFQVRLVKLAGWRNGRLFPVLHAIFDVLPSSLRVRATAWLVRACELGVRLPGLSLDKCKRLNRFAKAGRSAAETPFVLRPFMCPEKPWLFSTAVRMPEGWSHVETESTFMTGYVFAAAVGKRKIVDVAREILQDRGEVALKKASSESADGSLSGDEGLRHE